MKGLSLIDSLKTLEGIKKHLNGGEILFSDAAIEDIKVEMMMHELEDFFDETEAMIEEEEDECWRLEGDELEWKSVSPEGVGEEMHYGEGTEEEAANNTDGVEEAADNTDDDGEEMHYGEGTADSVSESLAAVETALAEIFLDNTAAANNTDDDGEGERQEGEGEAEGEWREGGEGGEGTAEEAAGEEDGEPDAKKARTEE